MSFYEKIYNLSKEYMRLYEMISDEISDDLEATADHMRSVIDEYLP